MKLVNHKTKQNKIKTDTIITYYIIYAHSTHDIRYLNKKICFISYFLK